VPLLKIIRRAIVGLVQQAYCLPQSIRIAVKRRRRQATLHEAEAERLDRIRNPSKYLGK
jgi:hypothetical protein